MVYILTRNRGEKIKNALETAKFPQKHPKISQKKAFPPKIPYPSYKSPTLKLGYRPMLVVARRLKTEQDLSPPDTGGRVVNTTKQSAVSELSQGVARVDWVPLEGVLVVLVVLVVQRSPSGHSQHRGQQYLQYNTQSVSQSGLS